MELTSDSEPCTYVPDNDGSARTVRMNPSHYELLEYADTGYGLGAPVPCSQLPQGWLPLRRLLLDVGDDARRSALHGDLRSGGDLTSDCLLRAIAASGLEGAAISMPDTTTKAGRTTLYAQPCPFRMCVPVASYYLTNGMPTRWS